MKMQLRQASMKNKSKGKADVDDLATATLNEGKCSKYAQNSNVCAAKRQAYAKCFNKCGKMEVKGKTTPDPESDLRS